MSTLRHDRRVSIEIGQADQIRAHNTDYHHARNSMLKIEMSEEQFARFVCSSGIGNGVPCTITEIGNKRVEGPPVQLTSERYYQEAKKATESVLYSLHQLHDDIETLASKTTKTVRDTIRSRIMGVHRTLADHVPWIVQTMHEHMDKIQNSAKLEIEAFVARNIPGSTKMILDVPEEQPQLPAESES
jgi:hypothetical protein